METIILFDTRYGTTNKVSNIIAEKLTTYGCNCKVANINENQNLELDKYDRIIIGGPIYAGNFQKNMKKFLEKNLSILKEKEISLFICFMNEEKQIEQFNNAFPNELAVNCKTKGFLGGEFLFDKMGFFDKSIVRIITKSNKNQTNIKNESIEEFVMDILK
ncbi:Flavodoxin-like protein [Methanococcus vannielii SB]|uniref:Flavodoxin-like protein n=1 Tax=Methanococcus vannielii (strain ATCC 35089 / DSM 1224 / JCM 13029 / OCM 148 / SB) TaxID=406327 RepID=A6UNB9_METVS|nr:flavodoxin domain-containing protein [Methanococcus vannielii]ABR53991.1 Flavodoxin-like protein [Methanococcus vannielii SB]